MESIEDLVCDVWRNQLGAEGVREVCAREGTKAIFETVARLFTDRDPRSGDALMFLVVGGELPEFEEAIEQDTRLPAALGSLLLSRSVHDRASAIRAFETLRLPRSEILATAAEAMLVEGDVISLAEIVAIVEVPGVVAKMLASDDWLFRWALLPYTNVRGDSALAESVRARLATDQHPLIAREAARHVAKLGKLELDRRAAESAAMRAAINGGSTAFFFGFTVANEDDDLSFRTLSERFFEGWLSGNDRYTLDELRAFLARAVPSETAS